MSLRRSRAVLLAAALALPALGGCGLYGQSGPTAVAQGRYFSSGNPDYDAFFIELHRLQVELKDVPERVEAPRKGLAQTLGTGPDSEAIRDALKKRADDLDSRHVKFIVQESAGPEKPPELVVNGSIEGQDVELKKLLDLVLAREWELKVAAARWQKELEGLPDKRSSLSDNVDTAFANRSAGTRSDVKANLADADKILTILGDRAHDAEQQSTDLLGAIKAALGTQPAPETASASTSSEAEPEHHEHHRAPPPHRAPRRAPRPESSPKAAPKRPAANKAPPKPEGELPPPPKPTQGTAKPDFEP